MPNNSKYINYIKRSTFSASLNSIKSYDADENSGTSILPAGNLSGIRLEVENNKIISLMYEN